VQAVITLSPSIAAEQLMYEAAVGFEAARSVSTLPESHRSRRLHGHSFVANVRVALPEAWASFAGGEVDELRQRLAAVVAPLDYRHLNRELDQPTDENLARWIRDRLDLDRVESVGVQSTRDEGVDLDAGNHAHVWRRYVFESAHRLPNVPPGHKCGRMHGHGFEVILHAKQVDYDALDALWPAIHAELDHACLNDIAGLENPTSELLCSWIWRRLKPQLAELSWVTVYETATCGAHFDGANYRIWKELTLDSASRLRHAPEGDKRRRVHGHTYTLRLHLHAPLHSVMGWTIDFGDVKEIFSPIFSRLDHQPLHELMADSDASAEGLVRWIKAQAAAQLPQLDRVDLYETRGCGAILTWGHLGPALPI
jgi:6-pyruvoyltetrahydropterin/6-carboxytetrahydropterin synthase